MNLREQLNQISIKHSIPSYQTGGVSENKWEIEDVSKNLLPQKQLKIPEINYLKDWLNSPMAVKIQKLKKDAEKAMRDNKDVIMNLMNRVVDNNDNNKDLFYAQEGGSLNNIRNILNNMYNKYE